MKIDRPIISKTYALTLLQDYLDGVDGVLPKYDDVIYSGEHNGVYFEYKWIELIKIYYNETFGGRK
jgi:hypothetical protein